MEAKCNLKLYLKNTLLAAKHVKALPVPSSGRSAPIGHSIPFWNLNITEAGIILKQLRK